MNVDLVTKVALQKELESYKVTFKLWPRAWRTYGARHDWTRVKLDRGCSSQVPAGPGIYSLILEPGVAGHPHCSYLMYVGQAESLRARFLTYLGRERNPNPPSRVEMATFLRNYSDYIWFCYTPVDLNALDPVEDGLISAYYPPLNKKVKADYGALRGAFD